MRIGFFGDGPWAHDALDSILESKEDSVVFVVARYPIADPVLKEKSEQHKIPFFCIENVNSSDFLAKVRDFKVDINVSMSFDQIIRKGLQESAKEGFLNCHAGALPFYRGRNVINWALINGERRLGVTVHYIGSGIDTGDIVVQRFFALHDHDNYATVLERAVVHCADALSEALRLVRTEKIEPIDQKGIHPQGTYFSNRTWGDEWIDWSWPAEQVVNFVRGITFPGPGARTIFNEVTVAILHSSMVPEGPAHIGIEGQVVGRDGMWSLVKAGDRVIRINDIRYVNSDGSLGETIERPPRVGDRFGRNLLAEIEDLRARLERLEQVGK